MFCSGYSRIRLRYQDFYDIYIVECNEVFLVIKSTGYTSICSLGCPRTALHQSPTKDYVIISNETSGLTHTYTLYCDV